MITKWLQLILFKKFLMVTIRVLIGFLMGILEFQDKGIDYFMITICLPYMM